MCLAALALDQNRRFPFVVAANRDEAFDRPAARLAWWSPGPNRPQILSGRDLKAGGAWMGLTAEGRFALVTNVRKPGVPVDPQAPSRGDIVAHWLRGDQTADRYWPGVALAGYQPFNLVAADFRRGDCFWATSERASPERMERGLFGLSNAGLDTPWPKVLRLKEHLREALAHAGDADALASLLLAGLADRSPAPDDQLPSTGVSREVERLLSPAFIRTPDGRYGTRCSTVIITERVNKHLVTQVYERTYTAGPGLALLRRSTLKDWPPKYLNDPADLPAAATEIGPVSDAELDAPIALPAPRKRRVRSLLKPAGKL